MAKTNRVKHTGAIIVFISIFFLALMVTIQKVINSSSTVYNVCRYYGIHCVVVKHYTKDKLPNAAVVKDKPIIYLVNDIEKILSREELLSILTHEVGHLVLKHYSRMEEANRISKSIYGRPLTRGEFCHLKRQFELEADRFVAETSHKLGYPNEMAEGLRKLVPPEVSNLETCTHPSLNTRIKYIRYYEELYEEDK